MKQVEIIIRSSYYGESDRFDRYLTENGHIWRGTRKEAISLLEDRLIDKYRNPTRYLGHNQYAESYSITYNLTYCMYKGEEVLANYL